jgi:hypothetical protein
MRNDKPKHKPSKKRTLEEVLKSLQDLIRNDFVPGATPEQPLAGEPAVDEPLAEVPGENATSIADALDTLDQLITREIIEPVERARLAPPEPLTDELLDFEAPALRGDPSSASLTPTALPEEEGLDSPRRDRPNDSEVIELIGAPDTATPAPTTPHDKSKQAKAKPPTSTPEARGDKPTLSLVPDKIPARRETQDFFEFDEPAPGETVEPVTIDEPVADFPTDEGEIIVMGEESLPPEHFPTELPLVPPGLEPAATLNIGSGHKPRFESDHGSIKAEPMGAAHKEPARARPPTNRASAPDAAAPTTAEDDIPVLNEVAEHGADLADPVALPGANQARDIAIRVIAKLNIERRKAGEPALDIKAIERLQRILTDTLSRHQSAGKPDGNRH